MVEEIRSAVKTAVIGNGDPATAFFSRGLFSSEFLLILIYCFGIYANAAWFSYAVNDETMNKIGELVIGWTGLRQIGKLATASPVTKKD